jgi:hypothetical protein
MASMMDAAGIAKALVGVGGVLIMLLGGAFLMIKSPKAAKNS